MLVYILKLKNGKFSAVTASNEVLQPKGKEAYAAFVDRVKSHVEDELLEEPEVIEINPANLETHRTSVLEAVVVLGIPTDAAKMLNAVIDERLAAKAKVADAANPVEVVNGGVGNVHNPDNAEPEPTTELEPTTDPVEAAKTAIEQKREALKKLQAEVKAEREALKAARLKAREDGNTGRKRAPKMKLEELEAIAKEREHMHGNVYTFAGSDGQPVTMRLVSVVVDRKRTQGMYRFKSLDNDVKGYTMRSLTTELTFEEAATLAAVEADKANASATANMTDNEKALHKAEKKADSLQKKFVLVQTEITRLHEAVEAEKTAAQTPEDEDLL